MKALLSIVLAFGVAGAAFAQQNLIPNGDFSAKEALQGWRIDFPYQGQYVHNAEYCRVTTQLSRKCIEISTPPDVIANQGAKVETLLVPVPAVIVLSSVTVTNAKSVDVNSTTGKPQKNVKKDMVIETKIVTNGPSYRAEVDCLGWDYCVKIEAEAYTTDPRQGGTQGQSLFVIPGTNGAPNKVMCWRAQFTDPPAAGKKWTTATREFTLPATWKVAGKECKLEWLTIKVVVWAPSAITGKSYFTNFRLYRTK